MIYETENWNPEHFLLVWLKIKFEFHLHTRMSEASPSWKMQTRALCLETSVFWWDEIVLVSKKGLTLWILRLRKLFSNRNVDFHFSKHVISFEILYDVCA